VNNLFSSEEEIAKWLEMHPELKGRPVMTVQELLDRLTRGERLPL
jgi:hypothetical protein